MKEFDKGLVRRNRLLFQEYTRLRRQYVYDMNDEKASVAFEIIPALLSVNETDLPGYVPAGDRDCGVYGFVSASDMKNLMEDYFPETSKRRIAYQKYFVRRPMIESLFLIGSIGTVAQTENSDFDFWVCVDQVRFKEKSIDRLRFKADQISRWCDRKFNMEVHFFVSDLEKIRRNDFGRVDEESTGSSQKKFLKEECYRTMLLVAGKVPLWWVLPPGIDREDYERHGEGLLEENNYDFDDLVDLGFLGKVSKNEFLGTALWNLSKGIKDPFKALLKMSMMERYLSDSFRGKLLCDLVKEKVLGGARSLRHMDPYLLLAETALDFYERQGRKDDAELVRKAFYVKADPKITRLKLKRGDGDYKVEVFRRLMKKWEWSLEKVEDLNRIENWSYARHVGFASELNKFFFSSYRRLSDTQPMRETQVIEQHDLSVLGQKIFALFSRQENKLQLSPFLTNKRLILDRCILQFNAGRSGENGWIVYDATRYPVENSRKRHRIFNAARIARAAAWLVINGIYDYYATTVEMPSNPTGVSLNELIDLLKHLQSFFPPVLYRINTGAGSGEKARLDQIMIVVDFEEAAGSKRAETMDLVYSNSWGEIFTEYYPFQEGLGVVEKYAAGLNPKDLQDVASRIKVHTRKSDRDMRDKRLIYKTILESLRCSEQCDSSPP